MSPFRVAIQPDDEGPRNSSSPIWARVLGEAGHEVKLVDVRRPGIIAQLRDCHGFMWRYSHYANEKLVARRLLPALERQMGLVVYPDQNTAWHYDDKIAQAHLFDAAGIPAPRTWIWYDRDAAIEWSSKEAVYPVVIKLATGAGSSNVRLVRSASEAGRWIERLFGRGVRDLSSPGRLLGERLLWRVHSGARRIVKGKGLAPFPADVRYWAIQKNYALFQEFLPGNDHDTRVTVIGNRAFAYRRFNRANDFRASGSGEFDADPSKIDERFVRLALEAARKLRTQSMAIDGLKRGDEVVVGEVSYAFVSWMVESCPGHWEWEEGSGEDGGGHGRLTWKEGRMWPEEAQAADFLSRLEERFPG